jgi:hypothetical protein
MATSAMRYFLPPPRQTNFLILLGCTSFGVAIYLRFALVEVPLLISACAANAGHASCGIRQFIVELHEMQFFGGIALVAAIFQLAQPRVAVFAVALAATCLGLVLYNVGTAGLAAGLLIISFARPAHASKRPPAHKAPARTTSPASSKPTR